MTLRRDNTAAIAMLEEPGWRTRPIYAEAIREELTKGTVVVTYVATDRQILSQNRPGATIPQWGLVSCAGSYWLALAV